MSRVGKHPVAIPQGVTVDLKGQDLKVKGKRGELSMVVHDDVEVAKGDSGLTFKPRNDSRRARMQWGTARARANNMVKGVSDGFTINLEINGVGYRAQADAKNLKLQLGFSHDVELPIPAGIKVECPTQTEILIKGSDRQVVGQIAAEVRAIRPPEPYKGKGIRYADERVSLKETKKK